MKLTFVDVYKRQGGKDIHMQVMVEDSGIGLEKEILSHMEVMGMVLPWEMCIRDRQYTEERRVYLKKHKKVSEYDSENLMY